jgi:hypothetical protein
MVCESQTGPYLEHTSVKLHVPSFYCAYLPDADSLGQLVAPCAQSEPYRISNLTLPGLETLGVTHVLWLTPAVGLCMQNHAISIIFVDFVQLGISYICPLVLLVGTFGIGSQESSHGPLHIVAGCKPSKSCIIFSAFCPRRDQCDLSVHLDVFGQLVGCSIAFELQSVLSFQSYEVSLNATTSGKLSMAEQIVKDLCLLNCRVSEIALFSSRSCPGESSSMQTIGAFCPCPTPRMRQTVTYLYKFQAVMKKVSHAKPMMKSLTMST